ncbi:BlaI/MecI/CopY family transcriptional regulator [Alkalihalobacillus sp. LMS39]|uniref:BlaI/MecI/CopY family transcriptional regulator n=1 Tax=Alkalihalobacillus sp. LMS39 TaxID=2924032 RepID=UPI001FB505A6|nr:BlaI/MecI/CopY family transcriptional regulator [Alkalihalobacillus sp. LMS39]UOE94752.1 BlaI/MecI/CopY family transcriptional regulator [Alkalihalobacillus sp. LMS39]
MDNFQSLSETEMKLMHEIWKLNHPVKSSELLNLFSEKEGKEWKGQTIATFLSRLVDKGMLSVKRDGRSNTYTPCLSLKEYKKREAQSLLNTMYQGSVKNFLATLYDDKVTSDELDELKKWFSDK